MKIVFIGAVEFSARALTRLIELDADVVGVCTLNASPVNSDHVDLKPIAESAGIAVRYTPDINSDEAHAWIAERRPDVIFCFGWSRLIAPRLLQLASLGVIGFHPAALPANRGRHPLVWALVLGLQETASTFFFMDEGADSGDILSQHPVPIYETDDAGTLYRRVIEVALGQISEFLPALAEGSYRRRKQDAARSNVWRKRGRRDGQIDWRMSSRSIYNLVRGLTRPYVGAHFVWQESDVKVWRVEPVAFEYRNVEPGKVLAADGEIVVKAGEGAVRLIDIEPSIQLQVGDYL